MMFSAPDRSGHYGIRWEYVYMSVKMYCPLWSVEGAGTKVEHVVVAIWACHGIAVRPRIGLHSPPTVAVTTPVGDAFTGVYLTITPHITNTAIVYRL